MSELDELRAEVAAMHDLDTNAAKLITGSTIEELEASAAVLAKLIAARRMISSASESGSATLGGTS